MDVHGSCFASSYVTIDNLTYSHPAADYSIMLANGTSLNFDDAANGYMYVDINGQKGPNVLGKDMHLLVLNVNTSDIKPFYTDSGESVLTGRCPADLKTGCDGIADCGLACGVRILRGDYATNY